MTHATPEKRETATETDAFQESMLGEEMHLDGRKVRPVNPRAYRHALVLARRLESERNEAREALREILADIPGSLECEHFHHEKKDRHTSIYDCPPRNRLAKAVERARAILTQGASNDHE